MTRSSTAAGPAPPRPPSTGSRSTCARWCGGGDRVFYLGGGRFGLAIRRRHAPRTRARSTNLPRVSSAPIATAPPPGAPVCVRRARPCPTPQRRETGTGLARRATAALAGGTRPPRIPEPTGPPPGDPGAAVRAALERGEIGAWYQPQLCMATGAVTGMERWHAGHIRIAASCRRGSSCRTLRAPGATGGSWRSCCATRSARCATGRTTA